MEVVVLQKDLKELITLCQRNNPKAQKLLYDRYSAKLLGICRQYTHDIYTAESILLAAFLKIFNNIHQYRSEGCFEAWARRITVHQCIDYIRQNKHLRFTDEWSTENNEILKEEASELGYDLQIMIDRLPEGSKVIFNLYVVEGYKHAEIAEMLGINIGTSKSQLAYARKLLQQMIGQYQNAAI